MKIFFLALVTLTAGVAVGVGSSNVQYSNKTYFGFSKPFAGSFHNSTFENPEEQTPNNDNVLIDRPKAEVVGSDIFDFGVMMKGETRHCEFEVKNSGLGTLTLKFDSKSCQCTDVNISKPEILPNESSTIYLSWKPRKFALNFSQNAIFRTNDPTRRELQFTIKGRVQQLARTFPHSIDFNQVTQNQKRDAKVFVYGYRDSDLKITDVEVLNEEYKNLIQTRVEDLEQKGIDAEPGAKSGALVRIELLPGLPMGTMYANLRIRFNKEDVAPLDVSIRAKVEGEIKIIGKHYSEESERVFLGTLEPVEKETILWLRVTGDQHANCEISSVEADPSGVLSAIVGDPKRNSRSTMFKVNLKVTPGDKLVNRLGNQQSEVGKIVFKTTHPDIPEFVLPVAFSIQARQ